MVKGLGNSSCKDLRLVMLYVVFFGFVENEMEKSVEDVMKSTT